ncbi:hypothetical protein E1B28_007842 [Marasmius oreades]|uniref:Uncharacterized protein n=1 Tax=Marasmius oreades TaxID=181124 RepID=A0A9P7S353_9AGAR|nr:uncharacterized protein E1B28_007842 [Marasmius oreades]KAG7094237.1 hypothetical protein E1B28_007842 [Marasmius oreades]
MPRKRAKNEMDRKRDKEHSKEKRRKIRQQQSIAFCHDEQKLRQHLQTHQFPHLNNAQHVKDKDVPMSVDPENLPRTSTGYLGLGRDLPERREYALSDLVDDGAHNFTLVRHTPEVTKYIPSAESKGVMVVISPGPENDPSWNENTRKAAASIEELASHCLFTGDRRRGSFDSLFYGISMGNGQPRPMVLNDQGAANLRVLERLRTMECFQRIAGFISVTFLSWAPNLFLYYIRITAALLNRHPDLFLPFANCIFAAFAVNFGPQTVCLPHRDTKNLAFGWCAVTALGDFDWTKGGHLMLWELKMVLEFPPGATIFIPSAVVCHFNTRIQPQEKRFSFTLYSAGGLFRWVEHGFQLEKVYQQTLEAVRDARDNAQKWATGLSLFSSIDALQTRSFL